ncbi:MAG: hypothetical protein QOF03_1670 [Alphaproteobacteria bacterium]|nr:hypothetical protein [Alphaproteobacteria bacterium]
MNETDQYAQDRPDKRVRYVLLAIEAELLSERAVSPYLREACLRLSRFWLGYAASDKGLEKFHAPTRARTYEETCEALPLCPFDDAGEDIGSARARLLIDIEMRYGTEFFLSKDGDKHAGLFGARRD